MLSRTLDHALPLGVRVLLEEKSSSTRALANLYLRTIAEIPDMTMVGEALRPDMFERLRELESFREYEAKDVLAAWLKRAYLGETSAHHCAFSSARPSSPALTLTTIAPVPPAWAAHVIRDSRTGVSGSASHTGSPSSRATSS